MKGLRLFTPYLRQHSRLLLPLGFTIILVDLVGLATPWLIGSAVDYVVLRDAGHGMTLLLHFAVLILCVEALRAVLRFVWRRLNWELSRNVEFELRDEYFRSLTSLPPDFFDKQATGDLMSRASSDVEVVRVFIGMGVLLLFDTLAIELTTVPVLLAIHWKLTLLVLVPMPLFFWASYRLIVKIHGRSRELQEQLGLLTARVQENLAGQRDLKAYACEESEIRRFSELSRETVDRSMALARAQAQYQPVTLLVTEAAMLLVLVLGGALVVWNEMGFGDFVRFTLYLGWLSWPMIGLGWTLSLYQRAVAAMERIQEVLEAARSERQAEASQRDSAQPRKLPAPARGEIELRSLSFRYAAEDPLALENISFRVESGKKIGIVGPIGSGKSTLLALIAKWYPVERGRLFVDGHDLVDLDDASLRAELGFVPQDIFLFSDSVLENIAFGRAGPDESDSDGWRTAAFQAAIQEEIERLGRKQEEWIGERGITLSAGQRQRMGLARALFGRPAILLLDDVFSNLDLKLEEAILERLAVAYSGRTWLLVSQRLSAVRGCDEIVVLDRGRLVEKGTHEELIEKRGLYWILWMSEQRGMEPGAGQGTSAGSRVPSWSEADRAEGDRQP